MMTDIAWIKVANEVYKSNKMRLIFLLVCINLYFSLIFMPVGGVTII